MRTKASVRCIGEELWWAIEQTPSEVEALVLEAVEQNKEFVEFTLADPQGEPSGWHGREVRLRTRLISTIAPPLEALGDYE